MGEVYRARDTRLNRDVALKVLLPRLTADPVALARFEREAQALAALSHPHIVAVYDVGRHEETAYVVMEYLDGETLRARLAHGPMPLRKLLEYGIEIAEALAVAHQRGIVHRDLKPENIFLTSDGPLKILDLGLAMLTTTVAASATETSLPGHEPSTAVGTFVGTAGYAAPEQARGGAIDARSDIFSLGAVLYEMASGRRAFPGDTAVDMLTAVLHRDPPELPPELLIPFELDRIVRRCLEKRPAERFQSARDLAFALGGVAPVPSATTAAVEPAPAPRRLLTPSWPLVAAAAALALIVGIGGARLVAPGEEPMEPPPGPVLFTIPATRGAVPEVSVSPGAQFVAWTALESGGQGGGVWVRRLAGAEARLLPNTPSSGTLFWSPDDREIVVADRELRLVAVDVERGTHRLLHELGADRAPLRGGHWHGQQLLVGAAGRIWHLRMAGGAAPRAVTELADGRDQWHGWPMFLPDGRRFLYTASIGEDAAEVRIASIDGGAPTVLALPPSVSRALLDPRGYVVFVNNWALFAQAIDLQTGALRGTGERLASEVLQNRRTGWAAVSLSTNGVVSWRAPGVDHVQFEWVDRIGRAVAQVGSPGAYTNFDLSPDESHIVTTMRKPDAGTALYVIDTRRNVTTLVSDQPATAPISDPTWSPDGRVVAFRSGNTLVTRNAFGGEPTVKAHFPAYPDSWSRDGRYLAVGRPVGTEYHLSAIPIDEGGEVIPLVEGFALADEPRFSPDGHWVAFHAAVQAAPEVYVIRFPPTGERWQVSTNGGVQPRWRADGRELYYLAPGGRVMAVSIPDGNPTRAGAPEQLFDLRMDTSVAFDQFTPSADGKRFLVRRPLREGSADTAPVQVLVEWTRLIRDEGPP
jgi:eukaryotic-like serine/threonine-protein kinase